MPKKKVEKIYTSAELTKGLCEVWQRLVELEHTVSELKDKTAPEEQLLIPFCRGKCLLTPKEKVKQAKKMLKALSK